jgi:hypothetical protein
MNKNLQKVENIANRYEFEGYASTHLFAIDFGFRLGKGKHFEIEVFMH